MDIVKGRGISSYFRLPSENQGAKSHAGPRYWHSSVKQSQDDFEKGPSYVLQDRHMPPGPQQIYDNAEQHAQLRTRKRPNRVSALLQCLLHLLPLLATITVLCLNILGVYWQDLGKPNQKVILQGLQYAAKAHEISMIASLSTIVIHRAQSDLESIHGTSFGLLAGGYRLNSPLYVLTKQFWGGASAGVPTSGLRRLLPLSGFLLIGFALTLVLGPSSAVAMIPKLDWWDVSKEKSFGLQYNDRVYFNRTAQELWPATITNAIYANVSNCDPNDNMNQDCAVRAMDPVKDWISGHQQNGRKPNITVFQDSEVTRYLTSQGGPPDNSSWTVTSTVPSMFARDLTHYWDWLVENSTLPTNLTRPRILPHFADPGMSVKKPLVQVQCHTYLQPDWAHDHFEFPHNELLTPPLDKFANSTWALPNLFVRNLKGNLSSNEDPDEEDHSTTTRFSWFDTASNFSSTGSPSLGAVVVYKAQNGTDLLDALGVCAFDSRWAEAKLYLDPRDTITIYQDRPNPMDMLNGTEKSKPEDLIRMELTLEWADTLNGQVNIDDSGPMSVVEYLLSGYGGGSFIIPEPEPFQSYVMKSLDWRLSTALGLYVTEGLARAFQDADKGSMLYREAGDVKQSYVRYLDDINQPALKQYYDHGELSWVEMRDPLWNSTVPPWDEWAPWHGYSEVSFRIQRNGYGYGFQGLPIKLATAVLVTYVVIVVSYMVLILATGNVQKGYDDMGQMLALAWSSTPPQQFSFQSKGISDINAWRRQVKVKDDGSLLYLEDGRKPSSPASSNSSNDGR